MHLEEERLKLENRRLEMEERMAKEQLRQTEQLYSVITALMNNNNNK